MQIRSLTVLILVVGGIVVPCLLITTLFAPGRVPAAIRLANDMAWTFAIEQSLLYRGYDVQGVQITEETGIPSPRNLVVALSDRRNGELQSPTDLVEDVHYGIGQGFAEWPFAPDDIRTVTLWVYPGSGRAYAVAAPVQTLVAWANGELDWDGYLEHRQLGQNAPGELFEETLSK